MSETIECEHLTKREMELLGRVWAAEVANLLPAQIGKSKGVTALHDKGYIEPMTTTLGGYLSVRVGGGAGRSPMRAE